MPYSRFTQRIEELPACMPVFTPARIISSFIFVGVLFISIGIACLSASEKVVEIVLHYDTVCVPLSYRDRKDSKVEYIKSVTTNKTCIQNITVPKKMKKPVFIYYQLHKFYQNDHHYVKSRDDKQLLRKDSETPTKDCDPISHTNKSGTDLPIVPCGLIAWSLFNDTYMFSIGDRNLEVNKTNIAWKSDKDHKFGKNVYPRNFQDRDLQGGAKLNANVPLSHQEDLMVWMRTAAFPTFRKLYGKIDDDLEAHQQIRVVIENNYNTYSFGGKKKLVLSTTTWIGGKNNFLGVAYLLVGGICLSVGITFMLLYVIKSRPLGDPSHLSWNLNHVG